MTTRLVPVVAVVLAGCSLHPVQQEVTGIRTADLVQYIRCETRLAIQDKAIELLIDEYRQNPSIPQSPLIAELTDRRGKTWDPKIKARMNAHERLIYDRYIQTGIAYDFSFDITEDNSASGAADPVKLFSGGAAGIGLSASGDFRRQNIRHFIVSETAQDLLESNSVGIVREEDRKAYCPSDYRSSNFAYPISGNIGMYELISTFFDLNELRRLTVDKNTSKVFADQLTFTTTVTGSASPHVVVAPVGNRWGLAVPAALGAGASRVDKHAVFIGLSLDTSKSLVGQPVAAAAVVPGRFARSALQRSDIRSPTEQSALDAISQARLDSYLDRAFR
ncbi:hypothetical protein QA641_18370 [Bradyrhizobium sp. CB1650]|uniref:hypothetical protein n=1 Tax=Bradyrhizobium sp. CB1650 TaxID=3039153 RepID=UPI00243580E8|nr:hypothetical protein [Bradyrhizobium sp. CB1650]WGD55668.1 hypothetical protein QA641_18370 [Bradyrhizobium sp. CB1650]